MKKMRRNPTLPQEVIEIILLKLPVKSLSRFRCVCKSWLSLISDYKFAKSHYDLITEPTHRFLFKSTHGSQVQSIDIEAPLDDPSSVVSTHFLPRPLSRHQFDDSFYNNIRIYGSCRGFLLVEYERRDLLVWNPSTGARKPIPRKPIPYRRSYHQHVKSMHDSLYGFWYDASTDDYLVLLMKVYKIPYRFVRREARIAIFSLKTNSWDHIEDFKFPVSKSVAISEAGLLFNGALHWLVLSPNAYHRHVIIAFDLKQRSLLEVPIPHAIGLELALRITTRLFDLRIMGDCLCLCICGARNQITEIWMMKEYKVQSSWTKSFVLSTQNIPHNFFLPICLTKSEGCFGSNGHGRLLKFNSKGVLTEHGTCGNEFFRENQLQSAMYTESILSLPP